MKKTVSIAVSILLLWSCAASDEADGGMKEGVSGRAGEAVATAGGGNGSVAGNPLGSGGHSGTDGGSQAGAGSAPCDADFVECCTAQDAQPCRGFSESECLAHEYCERIKGVPFSEGGLGGAGYGDANYLGCFSFCSGDLPVESCAFDPNTPEQCYHTPSAAAPDGWVVFECSDPPASCAE